MATIDIRTPQNVTIEYELASLRDRFAALFMDIIIVLSVYLLIVILLFEVIAVDFDGIIIRFIMLLPLVIFFFYQLLFELFADGQSIGKRAVGLRVIRIDGRETGLGEHALRAIFYFIDLLLSLGTIGALLISASTNRQRLGDMTANTTVIKVKFNMRFRLEDIMKINTLEDYEITYPNVKNLSEQDMLLIKNIISRYNKYKNEAHQSVVDELTSKVMTELEIKEQPENKIEFLKTLIRDYIVMTR